MLSCCLLIKTACYNICSGKCKCDIVLLHCRFNNTGGCGNVGCNNVGTSNVGSNNEGSNNKGDNNNGSNNVGYCLSGSNTSGDEC